jgi:general secretion pathway protein H
MRREDGFSLIEMLVAVAIMSLAAGLVVMTAPGPSQQLAHETDGLIRSLVAARDLALVENRVVTVQIGEAGYETRVVRRLRGLETTGKTAWSNGTTVATADGRLPALIVFDPIGLAEPAHVTLFRERARDGVVIAGSGQIGRLNDAPPN